MVQSLFARVLEPGCRSFCSKGKDDTGADPGIRLAPSLSCALLPINRGARFSDVGCLAVAEGQQTWSGELNAGHNSLMACLPDDNHGVALQPLPGDWAAPRLLMHPIRRGPLVLPQLSA